jgi:hypothetical protein
MKETLRVINKMQNDGVIRKYAIGGAMGAVYYLEAISTIDVDIFICFDDLKSSSPLMPLEPIFDYLRPLGYSAKGEHVDIEGELVQFLPAGDPLLKEALDNAVEVMFYDVPSRVIRAEHLMAIALRLGRRKDMARVEKFVDDLPELDEALLTAILARYGLSDKWAKFKKEGLLMRYE